MKKDVCEHCKKDISIHDEGVLHGFIEITENVYKRKKYATRPSW